MRDRKWIYGGVVVFAALALFPMWRGLATGPGGGPPDLVLPDTGSCVEDTAFMIANHPGLLNDWRNAVVREGKRDYVSTTGRTYTMNLTGTCMGCHTSRETFCKRCHDYADVQPPCWSCHVEP